jgi:hypothetical protein
LFVAFGVGIASIQQRKPISQILEAGKQLVEPKESRAS